MRLRVAPDLSWSLCVEAESCWALQGQDVEGLAELLAVQDLDAGDEEAMGEVDAALEEEWVERVEKEAEEVEGAGEAFVNEARPSESL